MHNEIDELESQLRNYLLLLLASQKITRRYLQLRQLSLLERYKIVV